MPGFILHLTAAQMLRSHLHEYPDFPYPIQSVNDFLIGNLQSKRIKKDKLKNKFE